MDKLRITVGKWIKARPWQRCWLYFWAFCLLFMLAVAVPGARPDQQSLGFVTLGIAREHLFDFVNWEASALFDKAANAAVAAQHYMTEAERTQYARDYLQLVYDIGQLEAQVQEIYADPGTDDPETASASLRARRDALRLEQQSRQALAEAIIEAQISELLCNYGLSVGGQVLPPVSIRFTQLPTLLVISPRDRIERIGSYPLEHGLTVERQEALESAVDSELGVSSLIVPLGGLAVYPSMLIETGYVSHVFSVGSHEWAHHYLTFFPLGLNYGATPELYTINETVASIIGNEISWAVLNRYYPDLAGLPPDYSPQPVQEIPPDQASVPLAFDFRAEMHATRVHVDELLAAGRIQEAEQYMDGQRAMFVAHGYQIRKLNQAYFAFYGAYADEPGATGSDPIGPALRVLRYYSPSLRDFVVRARNITSLADLDVALSELRPMDEPSD